MERRTSLRKAIRHDAVILLDGGAKWPCTISDFCRGGMYLSYSLSASKAISAALSTQAEHTFTLSFLGKQGQEHRVRVGVARKIERALGVRFLEQDEAATESLLFLSTHQVDHKESIKDHRPIIDDCVKEIFLLSAPLFEGVMPVLLERLKDKAVNAPSDQLANMFMEIGNQLKKKQQSVTERFLNALSEPIGFLNSQHSQQQEVADHLSLVDKNEFEDWLTSRVLITKSESMYNAELLPLRIRLEAIGLGGEEQGHSIFGPELFVLAYRHAIQAFISNGSVERILFKAFESSFMQRLQPLYEKLNEVLVKHGVLQDLDVTKQLKKAKSVEKKKPKVDTQEQNLPEPTQESSILQDGGLGNSGSSTGVGGPSPVNAAAASTGANFGTPAREPNPFEQFIHSVEPPKVPFGQSGFQTGQTAPTIADALDQSVTDLSPPYSAAGDQELFKIHHDQAEAAFEKVQGLLRSLHASEPSETHQFDEKFTKDELSEGLQALQAGVVDSDAEPREGRLLEHVIDNLNAGNDEQKGINEEQQVAIDVVDRFFVSLKDNPRLTDSAVQQLNKLEIPVLKVLLNTEGFFAETNHAVRQVMNRIAQLGAKGSRLNPSNQAKVESLVRRILENFDDDTGIFDEVLASLDEMVDRQSKSYSKNAERVAAAAEGVYRVDQAKGAVIQALNERLGGKAIPKAVHTLVEHGWKELLNLIHIRHGEGSQEWDEHLAIVDTLLQFSENPDTDLDMKTLLPKIQQGLKTVSGADSAPQIVREDLKRFIQQAPTRKQEMVPARVETHEESEETRESRNAEILRELKPWIKRVRAIPTGTWLKLEKEGREAQFMRLVWVAKGYSKFVFVNHQGMKVIELGLFKFARYLRDALITPDPDYELPIVNQGLDDMIKNVYEKLAHESGHDDASDLMNSGEACRNIRKTMASGDRHAACGLLYFRVRQKNQPKNKPSEQLAQNIGRVLKEISAEDTIIGRLNDFDFVLFSLGDDIDLMNVRSVEVLSQLREALRDKAIDFEFELGEQRGTLGFNNPESMLESASRHLDPVEPETSENEPLDIDCGPISGETHANSLTTVSESDSDQFDDQDSVMPLDGFSGFDKDYFEIFVQRAIGISERTANDGQSELVCSEKGSGLSYIPDLEKEARALDQWWLQCMLDRYQDTAPEWDSLGELRVKLSGYAFCNDEVFEQLQHYAEQALINPDEIWFDIYDSAAIDDVHTAADRILNLRELGYRFCLDQFGTVRAPFYLMKTLPVQMIKIDESYVDAVDQNEADEGPTESIVEVAHYLGRDVLAGSVDSAICLQRMRKLGIDFAQGSTISEYELLELERS